jgi:hypothetical protein
MVNNNIGKKYSLYFTVMIFLLPVCPAYAGLGDFLKSAVNTTVKVATAPTATVINAAQAAVGAKPAGAILDPVKNLGKSAGTTVAQGVTIAAEPTEKLYQAAQGRRQKPAPRAHWCSISPPSPSGIRRS